MLRAIAPLEVHADDLHGTDGRLYLGCGIDQQLDAVFLQSVAHDLGGFVIVVAEAGEGATGVGLER